LQSKENKSLKRMMKVIMIPRIPSIFSFDISRS